MKDDLALRIATRIANASALFPVGDGHAVVEVVGSKVLITVTGRDGAKREFAAAVVELAAEGV